MEKKPSFLLVLITGLFMGVVGAMFFMGIALVLRYTLLNILEDGLVEGSLPYTLVIGYPMTSEIFKIMPIAGAVVGMLGASIGYLRKSTNIPLWGLLAGGSLNIIFSLWLPG